MAGPPERPERPELAAVLHSIDEHLRLLWLILEELRVKLDEVLAADGPERPVRALFE